MSAGTENRPSIVSTIDRLGVHIDVEDAPRSLSIPPFKLWHAFQQIAAGEYPSLDHSYRDIDLLAEGIEFSANLGSEQVSIALIGDEFIEFRDWVNEALEPQFYNRSDCQTHFVVGAETICNRRCNVVEGAVSIPVSQLHSERWQGLSAVVGDEVCRNCWRALETAFPYIESVPKELTSQLTLDRDSNRKADSEQVSH